MKIVPTEPWMVDDILRIYDAARAFMQATGNKNQWNPGYPSRETLERDMAAGGSYAVMEGDRVVATFFFIIGPEPTYAQIYEGAWLNDHPYGVVHRAASDGSAKGVMKLILDFCAARTPHLRIDTHRDNKVMQNALLRYGFRYCGIIHLANGDLRLAYQWQK